MRNIYSSTWFSTFLRPISAEQTQREADFLVAHLPNPPYTSIIDLCCGTGRHAQLLAQRGYQVLGLDRDAAVIEEAQRQASQNATFLVQDMRALDALADRYDAIISLWQSFGYFDAATNRDLLRQMTQKLRPHGRLVLDIYHRQFFEEHQGTTQFERGELTIAEEKRVVAGRLQVRLRYGSSGEEDCFDWEVFTPEEFIDLAGAYGLKCLVACSRFDRHSPAAKEVPRMQLIFERY